MSEPEKVDTFSQPLDTGVKPQLYKCLLNQYAQKLWKQLPVYQTHNEGSEHLPKFRSTVWFDGVSYTSPNTFQQRKMAEMDASRIAFFATMQKLKDEASHLVREDKSFCKSILVEYAARMNMEKPSYKTIQLDMSVPVFRSSLVFNGVTCTGDSGRSKKEAEQSAARAVILKCLDSESGNIMSEIVKCKFRHHAEMKEMPSVHNGTNPVVQTGFDNGVVLNEPKVEEGTSKIPNTSAQPEPCLVQGTTIPATHPSLSATQTHIPEVSTQDITPVIPVPTVLAQTPLAGTNDAPTSSAISASCLGYSASTPATPVTSNVIQAANTEASPLTVAPLLPSSSPALTQMAFVRLTSGKKRNRKNKKNAQKKMRVEAQSPIPAVSLSQVPTFSTQ